jgi:hypothetical protein
LRPVTQAEVGQACKTLLMHASVIGMKTIPDMPSMLAVWSTHCRDMPAVLLASGLASVLKHWKNTFCLPAPGAVWEAIEPELNQMRGDLAIMERAMKMTQERAEEIPEDRDVSPEMAAMLAQTRKILASAGRSMGRGRRA